MATAAAAGARAGVGKAAVGGEPERVGAVADVGEHHEQRARLAQRERC